MHYLRERIDDSVAGRLWTDPQASDTASRGGALAVVYRYPRGMPRKSYGLPRTADRFTLSSNSFRFASTLAVRPECSSFSYSASIHARSPAPVMRRRGMYTLYSPGGTPSPGLSVNIV